MTRASTLYGAHARQVRYTIDRQGEARIVADDSKIAAPIEVRVIAYMQHREAAKLLRQLATEIEEQP